MGAPALREADENLPTAYGTRELAITPRVGRWVSVLPILGLCAGRYFLITARGGGEIPRLTPRLPRLGKTKRPRVIGDIRRENRGSRIPASTKQRPIAILAKPGVVHDVFREAYP